MNIMTTIIVVGTILLAANLIVGLVGWSRKTGFAPVHIGTREIPTENFLIGGTLVIMGSLWLVAWVYLLSSGWEAFAADWMRHVLHVILQVATGIGLFMSGLMVFNKSPKWRASYSSAIAILVISIASSLLMYGAAGHGTSAFMTTFAVFSFVMAAFMAFGYYIIDRKLMSGSGEKHIYIRGTGTDGR